MKDQIVIVKKAEINSGQKQYISVLSVLCALSVVFIHANGCFWTFSYERYWITANIIESVFYFAVPIFFMISGCNLLDYKERYDTKTFFIKRGKRAVLPFLGWSMLGLCAMILIGRISLSELSLSYIMNGILNTEFITIYWFFIPLFAIYLVIPFLSYIPLKSRKTCFEYGIFMIFIFSQLLPFLCSFIKGVNYNIALNFPLGGYVFWILCGYYIDRYPLKEKTRYIIYVCGIPGLLAHIFGTFVLSYDAGNIVSTFKGYTNIPCVLYSIAIFTFFKYMDKTKMMDILYKICKPFANVTLGIYFIHIFVLGLIKYLPFVDSKSIIYRTLGAVSAFLIAAGISKVMKKIPILKMLC